MSENVFINIKNRPITLTAEVEIPGGKTANGILIAQGGRFGGWALYVKDGIVAYDYNFLGMQRFTVSAGQKLTPANILLSLILPTMEADLAKVVRAPFILTEIKWVKEGSNAPRQAFSRLMKRLMWVLTWLHR